MRAIFLLALIASAFSYVPKPPFVSRSRPEFFRQCPSQVSCGEKNGNEGDDTKDAADEQMKKDALELLDCLTSPKNNNDPQYDLEKDVRRDELLAQNDYQELKVQLRARGLRTTGDKLEMITRLLLHIIDPAVNFNQMSGRESNLQYITKKDLESGDVRLVPEDQREDNNEDGLDAEDMLVLNRNKEQGSRVTPMKGSSRLRKKRTPKKSSKDLTVMDGLERRIMSFPILGKLSEDIADMKKDTRNNANFLNAYVVGGRDVLRTWEKRHSPTVIMLPDEKGWKSKNVRIIADEISFANQILVIVPSIEVHKDESVGFVSLSDGEKNVSTMNKKRALGNELLDRVIATVKYAHTQFDSRVITLSGVGIGGGLALEVATELSTLNACYNMYMNTPLDGIEFPMRKMEIPVPMMSEPLLDENDLEEDSLDIDSNEAFIGLHEDESEGEEEAYDQEKAVPRQVGAGVIVGTTGLDGPLKSNLLDNDDLSVEEIEHLLSSSSSQSTMEVNGVEEPTGNIQNKVEEAELQQPHEDNYLIDTGRGSLINPEPLDAESYLQNAMASFGFKSDYQNKEEKAYLSSMIKACAVFSPCNYNLPFVGTHVRIPTFIVFGEDGISEGSRLVDARAIQELMSARKINYSIRVYKGRKEEFVQDAVAAATDDIVSDADLKCSQEAIAIASIWLELFSRDVYKDPTDGIVHHSIIGDDLKKVEGKMDASLAFSIVSPDDLTEARGSALAKHIHDNPDFFDEKPSAEAQN